MIGISDNLCTDDQMNEFSLKGTIFFQLSSAQCVFPLSTELLNGNSCPGIDNLKWHNLKCSQVIGLNPLHTQVTKTDY